MTRIEWLQTRNNGGTLQRFLRGLGTMIHESAAVWMTPDPSNPTGPRIVPHVERPGHTLNTGRNADKRALRQGPRKRWRTLPKD